MYVSLGFGPAESTPDRPTFAESNSHSRSKGNEPQSPTQHHLAAAAASPLPRSPTPAKSPTESKRTQPILGFPSNPRPVGKENSAAAEGESRPECINSSNPFHECSDYCLRKIAEARQRLDDELPDSWKRPPEERTVHPDCINASNPYHECTEYCFKRIADAESRSERGGQEPPAIGAAKSDAAEQQSDDNDTEVQEDAGADDGYPQMTEKQKLFELRLKMNEARKANLQAMVAEKKRMEPRGESRGVSKKKWLEDRKKKIGKLLDSNGLDLSKAYVLDTQETAEAKYKKWEKESTPYGWDGELISSLV
ncbi:uncharacterized protein LOC133931087 [Phragmites australis]|uniref:uncharacterized protein LOC133931087 n=1 Tax=Phragmites australis TaxID=29695 RepID=UPI002D7981B5|nr:uncharacterized protein LOC133931087 [Phragmites australis]